MKKTKPIKKTLRSRCGAKLAGKGCGCYLKLGHEGWHKNQDGIWPKPWQKPLIDVEQCGDRCSVPRAGARKPLFCQLSKGHVGEHACAGIMWPKESPVKAHIATAPHCGAVDTERGWFCELAPGHSGEHQCGEYRWAHSYQEAAPPPAPQCCGSNGCTLPPGHTGWHGDDKYTWHRLPTDTCAPEAEEPSWDSASPKREQPAPFTQKLVLHLESGEVELSEVEAKALREYLNRIYLTPGFCGAPYDICGETLADQNAFHSGPGTVTVTGLDGKSFTLTNAVVTHHFYHGKKP